MSDFQDQLKNQLSEPDEPRSKHKTMRIHETSSKGNEMMPTNGSILLNLKSPKFDRNYNLHEEKQKLISIRSLRSKKFLPQSLSQRPSVHEKISMVRQSASTALPP